MIRLGVVGYGLRASYVIGGSFKEQIPGLRIVGVVDPDPKGVLERLPKEDREDARFYDNLDAMVRKGKLDALFIGTRCNLHTPYAVKAARYDLPLFLEKPVATSMAQAFALERAFEKSRCRVVVGFPLRVTSICEEARRLVREGAIGSPEHVHAVNFVTYGTIYWEVGYRNYPITQGLFLQKATHDFDYLQYVLGSNIVEVAAMANLGRVFGGRKRAGLMCSKCDEQETCLESPQNRKKNGSGGCLEDHLCVFGRDCGTPETGMNEDCSSALIRFASGAHGVYSQVFFSRRKDAAARGTTISGYRGTIRFDWYQRELVRVRHHEPRTDVMRFPDDASHFGGDRILARSFLSLIRGGRKSVAPIQAGIQSVYACLAAKKSSLTGRFVKVRQVGQA